MRPKALAAVVVVAVLCLVMVVIALQSRDVPDAPKAGGSQDKQEPSTPKGMARMPKTAEEVYISRKPVTVAEYMAFLRDAEQLIPDNVAGQDQDGAVQDLSLNQARDYATWRMMRLPTKAEWVAAGRFVGKDPYPWSADEDVDAPRHGAFVYLVRDWHEGTPAHAAAQKAHDAMLERFAEKNVATVGELYDSLQTEAEDVQAALTERWRQVKPDVYRVLELERELSELRTLTEYVETKAVFLKRSVVAKLEAVRLKGAGDPDAAVAEAVRQYEADLARHLETLRQAKGERAAEVTEIREQAEAARKDLEATGDAYLTAPAEFVANLKESVTGSNAATMRRLMDAGDELQKIAYDTEAFFADIEAPLAEKILDLKTRVDAARKALEADRTIDELVAKIRAQSEFIAKEFPQEGALVDALQGLAQESARKQGLRDEIDRIQQLVEAWTPAPAEPEAPAEPADDTDIFVEDAGAVMSETE